MYFSSINQRNRKIMRMKTFCAALITLPLVTSVAISQDQNIQILDQITNKELVAEYNLKTDDEIIREVDLPQEISKYIEQHFPELKIIQIKRDKNITGFEHEVKLEKGIELDFNEKNKIVEIESTFQLPSSVIPNPILEYVKTNYPEKVITDWKFDDNKQEVKLNNEIELEFNSKGKFLRVDY